MNEDFKFKTDIVVGIGDINYGGHLSNDKYLVLFQEARLRYLKQFDFSELNIGEGTSLIMSDAQIKYRAEAFWNEQLQIFVRITDLNKTRFTFEYLVKKRTDKDVVVAMGRTKMVAFDYQRRKVKRLPDIFVEKISEFESEK
ncbi:MAG: acyl-CoA thioesterase [Calditrichaeota bacterium]|nr:acyl-CoA thioesterase [Calditrichota bacterium]